MCQINTDPMKSQIGYLDVVGKEEFKKKYVPYTLIVVNKRKCFFFIYIK